MSVLMCLIAVSCLQMMRPIGPELGYGLLIDRG